MLTVSDLTYPREIVRITNGDGFQRKPVTDPPTYFDPATIVLTVTDPVGGTTAYQAPDVVKDSIGLYYCDVVVDRAGVWTFEWDGDSDINQGEFYVSRSRVGTP